MCSSSSHAEWGDILAALRHSSFGRKILEGRKYVDVSIAAAKQLNQVISKRNVVVRHTESDAEMPVRVARDYGPETRVAVLYFQKPSMASRVRPFVSGTHLNIMPKPTRQIRA